jgi:hypothetical protein
MWTLTIEAASGVIQADDRPSAASWRIRLAWPRQRGLRRSPRQWGAQADIATKKPAPEGMKSSEAGAQVNIGLASGERNRERWKGNPYHRPRRLHMV